MGQRRFFTEAFKTEAVRRMTEPGLPLRHVARALGVAAGVRRRWRRRHEGLPPRAAAATMTLPSMPEAAALRRLRRETESLRLEQAIPKPARGIFPVRPLCLAAAAKRSARRGRSRAIRRDCGHPRRQPGHRRQSPCACRAASPRSPGRLQTGARRLRAGGLQFSLANRR
jgi:transposase-like protein